MGLAHSMALEIRENPAARVMYRTHKTKSTLQMYVPVHWLNGLEGYAGKTYHV
jgi:hypothetical protein